MKSFDKFREGAVAIKRKKKVKSKLKNKKSGNVEVMPNVPDGDKGMTTRATNEAKNYEGPLYAPGQKLLTEEGSTQSPREQVQIPTKVLRDG